MPDNINPAAPAVGATRTQPIPALARRCSALLHAMFDERSCLFAYSTRLTDGQYVNDFSHRCVYRYTINSLAGIQRARRFNETDWDIDPLIDRFLALHRSAVTNAGDNGLLLYVLAAAGHPEAQSQLRTVELVLNHEKTVFNLNLQDISWMLAGLTKCAELSGDPRSIAAADKCWGVLHSRYFSPKTFLPYHSLSRCRPGFTSFGGVAYCLWSAYEYAQVFGDGQARATFQASVQQVTKLQGHRGEWPWFINANNGTVLDWYQLYSVHQDSMAMLFLLPALDSGMAEARTAIRNSYRWLCGNNELGAVMILDNPFFIYRSIRQKTTLERGKRYLRALGSHTLGWRAKSLPASCLEINRECRSYHIGWLLFGWAGTHGFEEFTELQLLQ